MAVRSKPGIQARGWWARQLWAALGCTGTMFVFGTFGTSRTFGRCLATDCSEHLANIGQISCKMNPKSAKMIQSQHVEIWGCQFLFWFRMVTSNAATGYVAKISMLRLNIGSGVLGLSSCMPSIGRGPKCEQGKGGRPPLPRTALGPRPMLSMHELSLSMPEPTLSLSMLILATYPGAALDVTIRNQNQN